MPGLADDTFESRTKDLANYDVPLDVFTRDVFVTRAFMSNKYGGSSQSTFPDIGKSNIFPLAFSVHA